MLTPQESNLEALRFPTGHSISQVKRNAKRLSDELNIPLNKALDMSARESLGVPESKLHWAQAVSILKQCNELYQECSVNVDELVLAEIDPSKSFKNLIVVAFDVKDAMEFRETGMWKQSRYLSVLMGSAIVAWLAQAGAEEEGRETPIDQDIEYAVESSFDYFCYYYSGSNTFNTIEGAIADLASKVFFPPEAVWMAGTLNNHQVCSVHLDGKVVGLRF
jgi:hypothetical protein